MTCFRTTMTLGAAAIMLTGCLRRIETIEVFPDGAVQLTARFEGDAEDLRNGDPLPTKATGWEITEQVKPDERDKLIRTARRHFAPGEELPSTYAASGTPEAAHALHCDTQLRIEQRPDGTYYHFRRTYRPRRFAFANYQRDKMLESGPIKAITAKDPKTLTDEERNSLAEALIRAEEYKVLAFVEDAMARVSDQLAQDARLRAWRDVHELFQAADLHASALELLGAEDSGKELPKLTAELRKNVLTAIQTGLAEAGVAAPAVRRFTEAYAASRAEFEITEDLGDETWVVAVKLPGIIIAHNVLDPEGAPVDPSAVAADAAPPSFDIDKLADGFQRGPDRCGWTFEGDALYDRPVLLMASSFVARP